MIASTFSVSITQDRLTEVAGLIDEGKASVAISERLPLDEAVRAHPRPSRAVTHGKLVSSRGSAKLYTPSLAHVAGC